MRQNKCVDKNFRLLNLQNKTTYSQNIHKSIFLASSCTGVYAANYTPVAEGPMVVEVKHANQQVPGSPFQVQANPGVDAKKVKVTGPGVGGTVPASLPAAFTVDTRDAGEAPLDVFVKVRCQ